jgi:hypothetical protein
MQLRAVVPLADLLAIDPGISPTELIDSVEQARIFSNSCCMCTSAPSSFLLSADPLPVHVVAGSLLRPVTTQAAT